MKVPTKQPKRGGLWLDDGPVRVCGRNGRTKPSGPASSRLITYASCAPTNWVLYTCCNGQ